MKLAFVDWAIFFLYFTFLLVVGAALKHKMRTSGDFLLSEKRIPAWVAGIAFISANIGAQEVIGMAASGAKYGMAASHFYWVGAVPAMIFLAIFMMPFYYGSRARSVPEYLKLRFDEKTRGFNAISFAIITVFSCGTSMYAMGILLKLLLNWDFTLSICLCAGITLLYTLLGGLTSAIYNEVLQFFLVVLGITPLAILGLIDIGGWEGLRIGLAQVATAQGYAPGAWNEAWRYMGDSSRNPMGVEWFGLVMGLGFVLSFGFWCTDFLLVQRAMAAESMDAARYTPLIAAVPKMLFPFLVIVPGMVASALDADPNHGFSFPLKADGSSNFDLAMPLMITRYFPNGLLGLGLTALMASFMSGIAGNITAFNTVWTYDIYQAYIRKDANDKHYLWMARAATISGVPLAIAAAYFAAHFNNIMDELELVSAFFTAPQFATFLLGMFWARATGHGAFSGLVAGTATAAIHHGITLPFRATPGIKGGWLGLVIETYPSEMAQNFWTAIWAFSVCFAVTIAVSLFTKAKPDIELKGLVYSYAQELDDSAKHWLLRPANIAILVILFTAALNIVFF